MSVDLNRVSPCYVRENYASILNEVAPSKLEDVVSKLETHFLKQPKETLAQCDQCMGWSDENLPDCPFCNDGKEAAAEPPPAAPVPAEVASKKGEKLERAASAPLLSLAGGRPIFSEKDLDESIARLKAASDRTADSAYEMGRELALIREHLWEQRTGEDGKPKYKSYNQFLEEELGISAGYGNKLRRIAETFTIDQFRAHGVEALKAINAAPKEVHEMLLKHHKEGSTVAQLEEEVREIRIQTGTTVVPSAATKAASEKGRNVPSAAATEAAAAARRKPGITVGFKESGGTIDLMARPTKKGEEPRKARTLEEQPYGTIEAINGKKVVLTVKTSAAGELKLKWLVVDEEAEE